MLTRVLRHRLAACLTNPSHWMLRHRAFQIQQLLPNRYDLIELTTVELLKQPREGVPEADLRLAEKHSNQICPLNAMQNHGQKQIE